MSTYYPDFPSTNFPDDVDSLWNLNDINSSTYEDALKYQQYISSGNLSAASDLLSKNTALQKTIINADKIIVLEKGKCVGIGNHKELLKNCDVYKQIALSQLSKEELESA